VIPDPFKRKFSRLLPVGIFLSAFLAATLTLSDYGVSWDEPRYFDASDLHIQWLVHFSYNLFHRQIRNSIQDESIKAAWHSDPYYVPHPPFSRIVSGATKAIFSPFLDKFVSYRLGPALFFALLVSTMYLWMTEVFGWLVGLFSVVSVSLVPNIFAFAHIAVTDMPLTAMWFLTVYCFWKGLDNWKWSLALGLVWGLTLATKFPALLIPIPLLLWAHFFRRDAYVNNIFTMIFVSPIVMIAIQPYLWHQPFLRILEFLYEGVSRGYRPETNYPVYFFGQPVFSDKLPKYYPFFLTAVTTPETILGLGLIGIFAMVRNRPERKVIMLFLFNALFILVMGTLPGAVLHDGMRQMLSVYPFLVALSGTGFFFLLLALNDWSERQKWTQQTKHIRAKLGAALTVLFLFPPLVDLILYHPFELSYYNRFVGGFRGAYDRGLEATYFMEAITPGFLNHLNRKLPSNAVVNGLFSSFMLEYYQKEGKLRSDIKVTDKEPSDYTVVLNRRSILSQKRQAFMDQNVKPYASVSLGGIPLVMVYETSHSQ
jgi:4-amino-4-deoxy-L-arabinose transferase-like glycosyltransferase